MTAVALFAGVALGWCLRIAMERANARVRVALDNAERRRAEWRAHQ